MTTTIVIETNLGEPWIETSPHDPQYGSVRSKGASTMTSDDTGPWTIDFPNRKLGVVVPSIANGSQVTQATVTLLETNGSFTVEVKTE